MKKNTILIYLLLLLLVAVFMTNLVAAEKKTVFRFAHMNAVDHIANHAALKFAEIVEEKTNGKVEIQVYPAGQLGSLQEIVEGVQHGSIAFIHNTMSAYGSMLDEYGAFDTPYLFHNIDHLLKVANIESPIMKELNNKLVATRGLRMITAYFCGIRHLTADRPIYRPEDLKGLKIRSIPFPMYTAAVEGMGAIAVPLDWAEVPTALATKAINGQENPYATIYASKIYEQQDYIMETGHIYQIGGYVVNEDIFQRLEPEIQKAILEAAEVAGDFRTQQILAEEEQQRQAIKDEGVTIIGPDNGLDIEAFCERTTKLVMDRFGEKYKEFYKQIEQLAK